MGKKQKPKPQQKRRQQQRQKKKESRSRETCLPFDIVREILVRCPVKTLAMFRCVCKQWGSVISQPSFQEDHHRQYTRASPCVLLTRCEILRSGKKKKVPKSNILHLSTYTSNGTLVNQFSKTYPHRCSYIPIQSCRGLVCFAPRVRRHPILICNPSTMELVTLPPTEGINQTVGFGYAASTKEFKVVRFFSVLNDARICCEVFTLGTSSWREAQNHPPQYPPDFFTWGAPFLHGALHMVAHLDSIGSSGDVLSIEAFDIDEEKWMKIPLPEYFHTVKSSLHEMYLKEFEGSLCLIFELIYCLEIWCLRDYHSREWVKKYSIHLTPPRISAFWVDPLAIMDDGNMMLNIKVKEEEALYYYNFHDKSFKKATDIYCWGTLYTENLLHLGSSL